ncbi:MAG TPA: 30S ribosome-binding factor RbfA [Planctomycetota bacterium]|nr:30S ribosome-binding factor RbfA [Planctomycetota bacterium]
MNDRRRSRLEHAIQHRIAEVLLRDLADPKLGLVTITRVELDKEFTQCKAFWSVLGDQRARARSEEVLARASGFVQREMGKVLDTRTVPRLLFVFDESIAGAIKVQQLLAELKQEREARTPPAGPQLEGPGPARDSPQSPESPPDR